jgi:hypothetical protein
MSTAFFAGHLFILSRCGIIPTGNAAVEKLKKEKYHEIYRT